MTTPKLNPEPSRTDLTMRECTKLIGGALGSISLMAPVETVRDAVRWWAGTDQAWVAIEASVKAQRRITEEIAKQLKS